MKVEDLERRNLQVVVDIKDDQIQELSHLGILKANLKVEDLERRNLQVVVDIKVDQISGIRTESNYSFQFTNSLMPPNGKKCKLS